MGPEPFLAAMDISSNSSRDMCSSQPEALRAVPVIEADTLSAMEQDIDETGDKVLADLQHLRPDAEADREREATSCETCGKRFPTAQGLAVHHLRKHGSRPPRRYRCSYCEYSSTKKWMVTRHERIHTGERPHVCEVCLATFQRKDHLRDHLVIHVRNNERPFECTCCLLRFRASSTLYIHKKQYSHY
ncbi:zinc finger X-chromosomal protein-like [Amblyomma americanum]